MLKHLSTMYLNLSKNFAKQPKIDAMRSELGSASQKRDLGTFPNLGANRKGSGVKVSPNRTVGSLADYKSTQPADKKRIKK